MRWSWLWSIGMALTLASSAAAQPVQEGPGEPRVFDLHTSGRSLPAAADIEVLPNGEIVVLAADGERPVLTLVDLANRAHALPVPSSVSTDYGNSVVAAPDGALLFSEGGRVLRRAPDGRIGTVAGRETPAKASGDGGPAVGAGMEPTGLALLPDGSLLVADRRNHRVRRVDAAGRISTLAGTGAAGDTGDGGPATQARLTAPERLSAYPDGSYLVATGRDVLRVRHVDVTGRISTVLGPGRARTRRRCDDGRAPALSLRVPLDDNNDIAAEPDGSFLITGASLGEDAGLVAGGVLRVVGSIASPVLCAAGADPARPDGRDLYVAGRPVREAFTRFPASQVAVAPDGGVVLNYGSYSTQLTVIASASQRLASALAPATVSAVFTDHVVIASTQPATARVRVVREGRVVTEASGPIGVGETTLALARRLTRGVHRLELTVTTADGRTATDRLRVLGRPFIAIRFAKRLIKREFYDVAIGEGTGSIRTSRCRHQGGRRVRCVATTNYDDGKGRRREVHTLALRPDGVLQLRVRTRRSHASWTYATYP
jgi:NHL repeat